MTAVEQLRFRLSMIEDEVLKAVHLAKWDETADGAWGSGLAFSDTVPLAWSAWRKQFAEFCQGKNLTENAIGRAVDRAALAAMFEIPPRGPEHARWKIIFDYKDAFGDLRKHLNDIDHNLNEAAHAADATRVDQQSSASL